MTLIFTGSTANTSILIYHLVPPLIPHAAGIDDLSVEVKDISDQL